MPLVTNVMRTLNAMVQAEVQRQRPEQQASSSAAEVGRGGQVPPSTQRQQERAHMQLVNDLCYEIQVLFPLINSNFPLAGPRPTAPLVGGHGTDAISTVYASRIETILRRYADRPQMLETFQHQLEAVLLIHTHNIPLNASHEHLIRELSQLIVEEDEPQRPGAGRRHQTNPSPAAQGPTNVLRAARDVQPVSHGETAALGEMIRNFGETGRRHGEAEERLSARLGTSNVPSSAPSSATAVQSRGRTDESSSSHRSSSGNEPYRISSSLSELNRLMAVRADSGEIDEVLRHGGPIQQARGPGATTAPAGGRNVPPATRGRTGGNNNVRGGRVPSAQRGSGPAQGGNHPDNVPPTH